MAYNAGLMTRLLGPDGSGNSFWRYNCADSIGAVLSSGYFSSSDATTGDIVVIAFLPYSLGMFLNSIVTQTSPTEICVSGQ
jgi:hypothetical protein